MASAARRWGRWVLLGAAVALVAAVGAPFVYIHFIEDKAPAPLTVASPASATDASQPASVPLDGTCKVAPDSQAGYRVKEVLFEQDNTAAGRTSGLTGQITVAGTQVTAASFTADLTSVKSDQSRRDSQLQGRIMDTAQFPTAGLVLSHT
jgi:polyisoprenoid-binding protein YceI